MELTEVAGYAGALAVGLVLGILGGGGSLLAVPIFSYLFHINPITTTAYSLFVVGTTATIGAARYLKKGYFELRTFLWFGLPALAGVFLTRWFLIHRIPETIDLMGWHLERDRGLMLLFAVVLTLAAYFMIRRPGREAVAETGRSKRHWLLPPAGFAIGALSGMAGIGGGFLIVPSLVLLGGLPVIRGVATSLSIVAVNALTGFAGNLGFLEIDWTFLFGFTALSLVGVLAGTTLSGRIKSDTFRIGFAWACFILAGFILYRELGI